MIVICPSCRAPSNTSEAHCWVCRRCSTARSRSSATCPARASPTASPTCRRSRQSARVRVRAVAPRPRRLVVAIEAPCIVPMQGAPSITRQSPSPVAASATHSRTVSSTTASGIAPFIRTTSWNSRRSNLRPERLLGLLAHAQQRELADLVRGRLARPHDVALDLARDLGRRSCPSSRPCSRSIARATSCFACMPVSTTSRTARNISACSRPRSPSGSVSYRPMSTLATRSTYSAQPSEYALNGSTLRSSGTPLISCCAESWK